MKTLIPRPFNLQPFIIPKKTLPSPLTLKDNFDYSFFDNERRFILIPHISKKRKLLKPEFFNITEIKINPYYHLIKNKDNKLFFIIINKIYNNLTLYPIK